MPPVVSPTEFLKTIWGDSEGFAELTAIGKTTGVKSFPWTYPGAVESLLAASVNHNKASNVYMGVCLRREKWPRATGKVGVDGKPIIEHRGTEANALLSWTVWVEFDFLTPGDPEGHKGRVVDPEIARKWLDQFPLKPSIVVRSGGGIQVYFLLKEAATGDELPRVKAINKALVEYFTTEIDGKKYGADTQSVDLARILRIPGSLNHKYSPPRPCLISYWRPDFRYTLDDFDFLPIKSIEKHLLSATPPAHDASGDPSPAVPSGEARKVPWIVLPQEAMDEIAEHVKALWTPGSRHDYTLKVAGMLAHMNICLDSATAIIRSVAQATNSDVDKRVKDVLDTYNKYVSGGDVTGRTVLETWLKDHVPAENHKNALDHIKTIGNIFRRLPKRVRNEPRDGNGNRGGEGDDGDGEDGVGNDPDFSIKDNHLIKFDSRPARWTVTLKVPDGSELTASVETQNFLNFRLFQAAFFEQTHCMLSEVTKRRWEMMIRLCDIEVKETPKEARAEGAIETALDEFLSDSRENPDVGMLTSFAGYDETTRFFRFGTLRDFMREQGLKIEDRVIYEHLRHLGFQTKVRRFGMKLQRVWMQALEGGNGPQNGNGHGGGPGDPPGPEKPVKSPPDASVPSLFQDPAPSEGLKEIDVDKKSSTSTATAPPTPEATPASEIVSQPESPGESPGSVHGGADYEF